MGDRGRNPQGLDPRPNQEWQDAPSLRREHLATMGYPPCMDPLPRPAHIGTYGLGHRLAPATKVATMYVACRSSERRARS